MEAIGRRTVVHLALVCFLLTQGFGVLFASPAQETKKTDFSDEPYVVESAITKVVLENDGTSTTESTIRVRIQSQAGAKAFGVLSLDYASGTSTLDMVYVRVFKPDRRVVETPPENVLDMPNEVTREAPFYSDLKDKQVAIKGLEVGDILEYQYREQVRSPLVPGQFWYDFSFIQTGICLDQVLQISIPLGRSVIVDSGKLAPSTVEQGGYKLYTWKSSHLESGAQDKKTKSTESEEPARPTVRITSFRSWDDLGQWIGGLFAPRTLPTAQIKAKADELTRGAKTDLEKIQALYKFVSENFRYVGIALGIGRYQPHVAADVLSNDYGDCKDKHTLFAALLAAENIKAFPALASTRTEIDPAIPSPAQFDHVITAIPQGSEVLFLDTTPEIAPFGFLLEPLRGKEVLVVADEKPFKLVRTPKDPPFKQFFRFQADGALNDNGTLDSKMKLALRGDFEIPYRLAFRNVGQSQWKDVMQEISSNLNFGGTVSNVTVSPPDTTETPFQLEYEYNRKTYGDWENRRIVAPFPPVFLPRAPEPEESSKPIDLGSPLEMEYQGTIKLPAGSHPSPPATVDLREDFAEYHSSYSVSNGSIQFERHVVTKSRKIVPSQLEAYRKFAKAISDDVTRFISLSGEEVSAEKVAGSPEARALYQQGGEAWQQRNMLAAADAFQRAVDKDPNFALAWVWLGNAHLYLGAVDQGIEEIKKAVSLDPSQLSNYKPLARTLMALHREDDALHIWKELEKQSPEDTDAPRNIASILIKNERYPEALRELDAAVKHNPNSADLLLQLAEVCFHTGDKQRAVVALDQSVAKDSSPSILNDVAFTLAENNALLDNALQYAQKAVNAAEDKSVQVKLDHLTFEDLQNVTKLAAYWDTLGWVYFHRGNLDQAQKFLYASWSLTQDTVVAGHLGEVYKKEGKRNVLALDTMSLQDSRTVHLGKLASKHVSAEFFVLFAPDSKVADVKFISGAAELRGAGNALAGAKFKVAFPGDRPAQILRRGVLDCEPEISGCVFVLIPPSAVRLTN